MRTRGDAKVTSPGRTRGSGQAPRRVSVVVPVRNEERSIRELLESLRSQTRCPDEVVICDGGSTDGTVRCIERYASCGFPIRLVRTGPALPGRARNIAIRAARFELIALTDAGIRLDPRWLERLLVPFETPACPDVVYGRFEPMKQSFRQRCIGLAFVPPRDPHSHLRGPSVASMAMRHKVWERLGGFREDLRSGEDLLFIRAVSDHQLSAQPASDAVAFWSPPEDFTGAFRRFSAYSYSGIRAGLAREWQFPLLRVYLLIAMLTLIGWWSPIGFLAPPGIMAARAMKRIGRELGVLSLFNIPLIIGVMVALATIDVATLMGCWRWLITDWAAGVRQTRAATKQDTTGA
jgi:glycosyltransferase involved in cell wall biosynthesis